MSIPFSLSIAEAMYAAFEGRDRVPLTKSAKLSALEEWCSGARPQGESSSSNWKEWSIRFYLVLGASCGSDVYSFPSVFYFEDASRIPDKATIKVWIADGLLLAHLSVDEVVESFELTPRGIDRLRLGSKQ